MNPLNYLHIVPIFQKRAYLLSYGFTLLAKGLEGRGAFTLCFNGFQ